MTGSKVFIDTNILIYAWDGSEPQKQKKALSILEQLVARGAGVISTQILAEFFVNVTSPRKFSKPMSIIEAHEYIEDYLQVCEVVSVTPAIVLEAARGVRDHQFSFWDAQVWATAKLNQTTVVYSEDFNVGAQIEGVRFINPLVENS